MKKILFILTISVVSILAKPCMTDIYFGNGVWNTPTQASKSAKELRKFMQINYNARLDRNKEGETYQFMPPTYNPTRGTIEDLLETFWQLKESGQISEGYFTAKWNLLTADRGPDELRKAMNRIATTNTVDVNQMYQRYKVSSLDKKNNILLVAHSQGNLFGNKIYTILTDQQKQKFRMVSVATPANHVMKPNQTSPYVTAKTDYVINRISGALSGNVDGVGHTFIGTYLGSSFEARTQIALYVKSAYDNLMQTTACNDSYNTVYLTMDNAYSTLTVLGTNREITPVIYDTLASFQLEQLPAEYDIHGNASCKYWVANYICTNGINNSQCTLNLSEREGGMILSPQDIADYKYFKLSMLHGDTCATVDIADGIYEVVRDALYN